MLRRTISYLIFMVLLSPSVFSQMDIDLVPVNYVSYQKPLPNVLAELSLQNQINIVYNKYDIPSIPISINAKKFSLRETMDYILEGTNLIYEAVDHSIVIYKKDVYLSYKDNISGYVTDKATGDRLPHADIYLHDFTDGTSTNDYGYFNLNLSRGDKKIICSFVGYHTQEFDIRLRSDRTLNIQLDRQELTLIDEVLITADRFETNLIDFFKPGKIDVEEMSRMVSLGGEDDILRLLYAKSGVLTGADGFGGMHVRGGNADQNLILLDGAPVYNAQHAIGLYSVFNSSVIQSSKLLKGDFPARYGGSASSVLDIRTKNGDKTRHRGSFNLGLFTVKAGIEGPIVPGKVTYLVSGRRTYADIWVNTFREYLNAQQGSEGKTNYYNFDINAKIHATINDRNNLFLSYYEGGDNYYNEFQLSNPLEGEDGLVREERDKDITEWANRLITLKWTSNPASRVFIDNSVIYSRFGMDNFGFDWVGESSEAGLTNYRFSERFFLSGIEDIGFQSNMDFYRSAKQTIRFGLKTTRHAYNPAVLIFDSETFDQVNSVEEVPDYELLRDEISPLRSVSWENRLYFENEREYRDHTRLNIGVHISNFIMSDDIKTYVEPRIILNTRLTDKTVFTLSGTRMSQFLHLLNNNGLGFPSQVWLPSTSSLKPQLSWQFATGIHNRHNKALQSYFQAYYKSYDELVMADAGEYLDISEGSVWDDKLPVGSGFSYGIESGISWGTDNLFVDVNYNLLYARRKFEELNGGLPFDHRFSRRHNTNLSVHYKFNRYIGLSLNWTYGSGNPYTFPSQIVSFVEDGKVITKFVYESLNNQTLPDYHRLDFEFSFNNKLSWGTQKFTLGAYNSYNRKNPFYITFDNSNSNINEISNTSFKYVYVFPLIPVLNYSIEF